MCDNNIIHNDSDGCLEDIHDGCLLCGEETHPNSNLCNAHRLCSCCEYEWSSEEEAMNSHETPDGFVCSECYTDRGTCRFCSGSGEGMYDGSTCSTCKGSGESSSYADEDYDRSYEPDYCEDDFEWGY